jgi:acyl-CoA dehydrogenase
MQEVVRRGTQRQAFGKYLLDLGSNSEKLALNRVYVRQAQLAALDAARELDIHEKVAGRELEQDLKIKLKLSSRAVQALAVCKIACPRAAQQCLDLAIQIHGGGGLSADHPLAQMWAAARTLRLVDGPDEVHLLALSRAEKKKQLIDIKNQGSHPGVGFSRL